MKEKAPLRKTIHPPYLIEPVDKNARVSEHIIGAYFIVANRRWTMVEISRLWYKPKKTKISKFSESSLEDYPLKR